MANVKYFKDKLSERRQELATLITDLESLLDDPKNPDAEERAVEREGDEVMERQVQNAYAEISAIDAALGRLNNNTYGICFSCHQPISEERLEVVPHALVCRKCM